MSTPKGYLTLFEFDTLRPLYRIQFETRMIPKALVFSSDSQRIIEITRDQCRLWAPTVLLRTDPGKTESGETVSVSSSPQEVGYQSIMGANITAIACCQFPNVIYAALENGSVYAYDISGEPERQLLYTQTRDCPIYLLYVDEPGSLLVSGDIYGRVMVHKVARRNVLEQNKNVWNMEVQLLFERRYL